MIPSGTDIRRMLAKALEAKEANDEIARRIYEPEDQYSRGVVAALAWVLGERGPPIP